MREIYVNTMSICYALADDRQLCRYATVVSEFLSVACSRRRALAELCSLRLNSCFRALLQADQRLTDETAAFAHPPLQRTITGRYHGERTETTISCIS